MKRPRELSPGDRGGDGKGMIGFDTMNLKSNKCVPLVVLAVSILAMTGRGFALGDWYVAGEAGSVGYTYTPLYTYDEGSPDSFINEDSGLTAGLLVGYEFSLSHRLGLGIQTRLSGTRSNWELDVLDDNPGVDRDGPGHIRYSLPAEVFLSAVARVSLSDRLSLLGEAGVGKGLLHEKKTSEFSTNYDFSQWTNGAVLGAGFSWSIWSLSDVYVMVRHTRYSDVTYESAFPDGTKWETIQDNPESTSVNIGLRLNLP